MRQAKRTAVTSVLVFLAQAVVALLITRLLVRGLGVREYAMIPLANSFIPYLIILASSLAMASSRELTIMRSSGRTDEASGVLSTGVAVSALLAIGVATSAVALGFVAPRLLGVPVDLRGGARLLILTAGISAALAVMRGPVLAIPFSENRLDLENLVIFSEVAMRAMLIAGSFTLFDPRLSFVAIAGVIGALVALLVSIAVSFRLAPTLVLRRGLVNWPTARRLLHVGAWSVIGNIGALLFLSTDLFVLSVMTTAVTVGLYGTVAVWPVFLRGLAGAATSFLNPILVRAYGSGNRQMVVDSSVKAVRLLGIGSAIPVGVIAGLSAPLLHVWLGPDFVKMSVVLTALILPLGLNLAVTPLFGVNVSYGRLAAPGIATLIAGVANIVISVLWARQFPYGLGVALGTAVALTAKNAIFTPVYAARIQQVSTSVYFRAMLPGTVLSLVIFAVSRASTRLPGAFTPVGFMTYALTIAVAASVFAWWMLMSAEERSLLAVGSNRSTQKPS